MIRRSNQKVKNFTPELRIQATKCNFGYRLKTQLHDRLIAGINMLNLEKELIQKPKVLFQEVRTTCNNHEALNEFDFQSVKFSITFLSCRDELKCQTRVCLITASTLVEMWEVIKRGIAKQVMS